MSRRLRLHLAHARRFGLRCPRSAARLWLTGGAAIYGNAVKNAAQIAVDEINAKGGIQFELRHDDPERPENVNAYNTLKDWHADLLRPVPPSLSYRRRCLADRILL